MSTRSEGEIAFWKAAENGDKEKIRVILDKMEVDINMKFDEGKTVLHAAASKGHELLVDFLCRRGADINKKANYGWTPLHSAVLGGNINIVKKLINLKADVNSKTNKNLTPLHFSIKNKDLNIIEFLLNNDADVNCATKSDGDTPLILAMKKASCIKSDESSAQEEFADFLRITEMLLKKGASVNSQNFHGSRPLHHAARIDLFRPEIVKLLLDYGADVNAGDGNDATCIFYTQNEMILETLIERGANVNYRSFHKVFTPLSEMVRCGRSSCVEVLLMYGANVNIQDYEGKTILEINCPWAWRSHKKDQILESVINRVVDLNLEIHRLGHNNAHPEFIKLLSAIIVKRKVTKGISIDVESLEPDNPNSRFRYFCSRIPICETEIIRMKATKINVGELSVFDVLDMPISKLLDYVERKEFLTLESDNFEKDFPFYARILRSHIKQARERRSLIDSSAEAFEKLIFNLQEIKLPDLVVDKIVSMLSNGYLSILAQV